MRQKLTFDKTASCHSRRYEFRLLKVHIDERPLLNAELVSLCRQSSRRPSRCREIDSNSSRRTDSWPKDKSGPRSALPAGEVDVAQRGTDEHGVGQKRLAEVGALEILVGKFPVGRRFSLRSPIGQVSRLIVRRRVKLTWCLFQGFGVANIYAGEIGSRYRCPAQGGVCEDRIAKIHPHTVRLKLAAGKILANEAPTGGGRIQAESNSLQIPGL